MAARGGRSVRVGWRPGVVASNALGAARGGRFGARPHRNRSLSASGPLVLPRAGAGPHAREELKDYWFGRASLSWSQRPRSGATTPGLGSRGGGGKRERKNGEAFGRPAGAAVTLGRAINHRLAQCRSEGRRVRVRADEGCALVRFPRKIEASSWPALPPFAPRAGGAGAYRRRLRHWGLR